MDRLAELGTARGFAEQRVARAEAELAEAKRELGKRIGAYIDYVKLRPWPGFCQSCFTELDPPDATSCKACGADDIDD